MTRLNLKLAAPLCTVFAIAAFCVLPPLAAAGDATSGGGAGFADPVVSAPKGAFAGKSSTITGHVAPGSGQVSIEARLGQGPWTAVATASTDAAGDFTITWKPFKAGRYDFRITPTDTAIASSNQEQGPLSVYRRQKATWYGPGFYGHRTACNIKLTRRTLGVAHRSLPCGSKVEFFNAGRKVTVPVIDRGPYVHGVTWDLTLATARALGTSDTVILGALPLPQ
ncbi:MAG: septal ring lytic transglycosylase RlpA family protein [Solirubrobacterales bacterium]